MMKLTNDEAARSVLVSRIPRVTKRNLILQRLIQRHFEWAKNGGGKIDRIQFPSQELAVITFENMEGLYIENVGCCLQKLTELKLTVTWNFLHSTSAFMILNCK